MEDQRKLERNLHSVSERYALFLSRDEIREDSDISLDDSNENPLFSDLHEAFDNAEYADVCFVAAKQSNREESSSGEGRIHASKALLALCSPVFSTMFASGMKESVQDMVEIRDTSYEALYATLSYIDYPKFEHLVEWRDVTPILSKGKEKEIEEGSGSERSKERILKDEVIIETLTTSDMFQVASLRERLQAYVAREVDVDNACYLYELSERFQFRYLSTICLYYILAHYQQIRCTLPSSALPHTAS